MSHKMNQGYKKVFSLLLSFLVFASMAQASVGGLPFKMAEKIGQALASGSSYEEAVAQVFKQALSKGGEREVPEQMVESLANVFKALHFSETMSSSGTSRLSVGGQVFNINQSADQFLKSEMDNLQRLNPSSEKDYEKIVKAIESTQGQKITEVFEKIFSDDPEIDAKSLNEAYNQLFLIVSTKQVPFHVSSAAASAEVLDRKLLGVVVPTNHASALARNWLTSITQQGKNLDAKRVKQLVAKIKQSLGGEEKFNEKVDIMKDLKRQFGSSPKMVSEANAMWMSIVDQALSISNNKQLLKKINDLLGANVTNKELADALIESLKSKVAKVAQTDGSSTMDEAPGAVRLRGLMNYMEMLASESKMDKGHDFAERLLLASVGVNNGKLYCVLESNNLAETFWDDQVLDGWNKVLKNVLKKRKGTKLHQFNGPDKDIVDELEVIAKGDKNKEEAIFGREGILEKNCFGLGLSHKF